MAATHTDEEKFDVALFAGAFLALYWILYVAPNTGEIVGLALGSLPVLVGAALYLDQSEAVSQGGIGLAVVALGGATPATVLHGTPAGTWLVGSQPLPLALGWLLLVGSIAIVVRRRPGVAVAASDTPR